MFLSIITYFTVKKILFQHEISRHIEQHREEIALLETVKEIEQIYRIGFSQKRPDPISKKCRKHEILSSKKMIDCLLQKEHWKTVKNSDNFTLSFIKTRSNQTDFSFTQALDFYGHLLKISSTKEKGSSLLFHLSENNRSLYLPQRLYAAHRSSNTIEEGNSSALHEKDFLFDNLESHYFIDIYPIQNSKISSLQKMKEACSLRGKQLLTTLLFDAATFLPTADNPKTPFIMRGPYPWSKTFAKEKNLPEKKMLLWPSWMGIRHLLGNPFFEVLENPLKDRQENINVSSTFIKADSPWHQLGLRASWSEENSFLKDFDFTFMRGPHKGSTMGPEKVQQSYPLSFRCYQTITFSKPELTLPLKKKDNKNEDTQEEDFFHTFQIKNKKELTLFKKVKKLYSLLLTTYDVKEITPSSLYEFKTLGRNLTEHRHYCLVSSKKLFSTFLYLKEKEDDDCRDFALNKTKKILTLTKFYLKDLSLFKEDKGVNALFSFYAAKERKSYQVNIPLFNLLSHKHSDYLKQFQTMALDTHLKSGTLFSPEHSLYQTTLTSKDFISSFQHDEYSLEAIEKSHCTDNCHRCRDGHFEVPGNHSYQLCGIKKCGGKGEFACMRGRWLQFQKDDEECVIDSLAGICRNNLRATCNLQQFLRCQ